MAQAASMIDAAVESEEAKIREMVKGLNLSYPNMMATPEVVQQFGDILSVPGAGSTFTVLLPAHREEVES